MAEKITKKHARELIDGFTKDMEHITEQMELIASEWDGWVEKYGADQMEECLTGKQIEKLCCLYKRMARVC